MSVELAEVQTVSKPWGVKDLAPWRKEACQAGPIGEVWFERPGITDTDSTLLLKLLFTTAPLSIQVHPTDAYAHKIGLPHGKMEAWYVLDAEPDAKVAIGLKQKLASEQLHQSLADGTFSDFVRWRKVETGDVIFVPGGTIHAIGAGLVIAEIQQRGGVTFRMFDYGRPRELHIQHALEVANAGPVNSETKTSRLSRERTLLVSNTLFVFERIDLPPVSGWRLEAENETWLLFIDGEAVAGAFDVATGDVIFAESDCVDIQTGATGASFLAAYLGSDPATDLLHQTNERRLPKEQRQARAVVSN